MRFIDWILFAVPLVIVLCTGIYTNRYLNSVADFLSGGRLAGRYLLAVSRGEMAAGAAVFVGAFEVMSQSGFTMAWWANVNIPIGLLVAVSGFVVYRYRETRAMTLAQFFEIRYSKSFRLFTGILGFTSGLVNFGIIPAVGARFFVYFLELPPSITLFGNALPTYIPVMGVFLSITLALTLAGGLITVMIVDCMEGILSQLLYLIIIVGLLSVFRWSQISEVLGNRPPHESFLNPFDSSGLKDFNMWYVLMGMFVSVYGTMAWQNQSSYNAASLTAHESRMGWILGKWREMGKAAVVYLLACCALTFLSHPDFANQSAAVHRELGGIANPQIQKQMQIPVALAHLLPPGAKGALCAVLLMGIFGGDSTHLHSWGGIFIQDILVPLRRKPFGPKQHIRLLRWSITGVALFAFIFGSLFRQTEYIYMWWSVTQAIYVGGAGAAIIGGLYWKKGTAAGAWTALLTGSILSVGGILARQVFGDKFPLNGMEISFSATLIAIAAYAGISLLTCKEDFNMDRMLHRGQYARVNALTGAGTSPPPRRRSRLGKLIGFDDDFTRGDRWVSGALVGWGAFGFGVFAIGTIWNMISPWPLSVWSVFWHINGIGLPILFAVITAVWFTWGGLRDIRALFRRLSVEKINHLDDGTVINHLNLDDAATATESLPADRPDAPRPLSRDTNR